jgi:hypothetical protein
MHSHRAILALGLTALLALATAFGQVPKHPDLKSAAARDALAEYRSRIARLDQQYRKAANSLSEKYGAEAGKIREDLLSALDEARKAATAADDLDEAVVLRDVYSGYKAITLSPPEVLTQRNDPASKGAADLKGEIARLKRENTELKRKDSLSLARKETVAAERQREELRAFLNGTRWQWSVGGYVHYFQSDVCWLGDNPKTKHPWHAISGNTIEIAEPDTKDEVTFDGNRMHFLWVQQSTGDIRTGKLMK